MDDFAGRPLQQQRQQQPTIVKANNLDRRKINVKVRVNLNYLFLSIEKKNLEDDSSNSLKTIKKHGCLWYSVQSL